MIESSPRERIANLVLDLEFTMEQGQVVIDDHLYPEPPHHRLSLGLVGVGHSPAGGHNPILPQSSAIPGEMMTTRRSDAPH